MDYIYKNSRGNLRAFRAAASGLLFFICILYATPAQSQQLFVVNYEYRADFKVFKVKYPSQADLLVYVVPYPHRAKGNKGLWYFTDKMYTADKKIFFTKYAYRADIKVYFVKYPTQSRWRNQKKLKYLLY